MTKRDYIKLAAALRSAEPTWNEARGQWLKDIGAVAAVLGDDNPRFDLARFFEACTGDAYDGRGAYDA